MKNAKNLQVIWKQAEQSWNRLSPQNQKVGSIIAVVAVLGLLGSVFSPTPALSE
jgi:hypothetical protein